MFTGLREVNNLEYDFNCNVMPETAVENQSKIFHYVLCKVLLEKKVSFIQSFFCSQFNTIQLLGLYLKPEATRRDIFFMFLLFFLVFKFVICTNLFFVVAYIDNVFLNMRAVLISVIFCISARFCLPLIFSGCFAVLFFTNPNAPTTIGIIDVLIATFFLIQSEDLDILMFFKFSSRNIYIHWKYKIN